MVTIVVEVCAVVDHVTKRVAVLDTVVTTVAVFEGATLELRGLVTLDIVTGDVPPIELVTVVSDVISVVETAVMVIEVQEVVADEIEEDVAGTTV